MTVCDAPTGAPVRLVFGPHLDPRTDDVTERVFEALHHATYDPGAKQAAWTTVAEPIDGALKLARLQALALPPALLSSVTERASEAPRGGPLPSPLTPARARRCQTTGAPPAWRREPETRVGGTTPPAEYRVSGHRRMRCPLEGKPYGPTFQLL